tara:strand:+ start:496 stop:4254 length:3759 start_codon:yes stop_codon:yes gene_type:complete
MCGISGTIYQKKVLIGKPINIYQYESLYNSILNNENREDTLLNLCWKSKNNVNFINYCKNINYRKDINKFIQKLNTLINIKNIQLDKIDRNVNTQKYIESLGNIQKIRDCKWFLETEISRWIVDIEFLSGENIKDLSDHNIIFYKNIISIIRSIDQKLELRGRDSFGITIQINIENKSLLNEINSSSNKYLKNCKTETFISRNRKCVNFSFKTFNKIGALGENANLIKELIKKEKIFKKIVHSEKINSALIIGHTRWASVGSVDIENTHPIFCKLKDKNEWFGAVLNGDIYNYKNILEKNSKVLYEKKCTTDCLAVPFSFANNNVANKQRERKLINKFDGSFTIGTFNSKNNNLSVFKKGTQGLYLGVSDDNIMFASDVYGLIEFCQYFYPIQDQESFSLNIKNNYSYSNFKFGIKRIDNEKQHIIKKNQLKKTIITTRDIDRKGYNHFLEKEIFDTGEIIESTINRYIQKKDRSDKYEFAINEKQVPKLIANKFKKNKINKVIITGMGTCYTAAVAISNYMRFILRNVNESIIVEPHIASEGSGFYLDPDMSDVLVIVVAQSGTTIDTNIYVKMAKERGAISLAIANKREGDVTFIVDGTLYIGEGRDIEISVPSTKTYTAQVVVGYIISLYMLQLCSLNSKLIKLIELEIKKLKTISVIVEKTLKGIKKEINYDLPKKDFLKYTSWIVGYDDSENSVCASEIRIKLSENCYQSLPYLEIDKIIHLKIQNSFIVIITNKNISEYEIKLQRILSNNNSLILICPFSKNSISKSLKRFVKKEKLTIIGFENQPKHLSFIPTILIGQYLSYKLAKFMDDRSLEFINLKKIKISEKKLQKRILQNINQNLKKGFYNIGISENNIFELFEKYDNKLFIDYKLVDSLISQTRRTIDTIKHQAKTITVGAVRSSNKTPFQRDFSNIDHSNIIENIYENILNTFSKRELDKIKFLRNHEIYLNSDIDEAYLYNITNFINEINKKIGVRSSIKLSQRYDLKINRLKNKFIFINLNFNENKFKKKGDINFNFKHFKKDNVIKEIYTQFPMNNLNIDKLIWSFSIGIVILEKLFIPQLKQNDRDNARNRIDLILKQNFNLLQTMINNMIIDKSIYKKLDYSAKLFKKKNNIKSLGSGVNYNFAKYASKKVMNILNRACAFDVLENHKHIDISAESCLLVFLTNIERPGYQNDAYSEIQKMISHSNLPIIITNSDDDRFDNIHLDNSERLNKNSLIIKIPKISEEFTFFSNFLILEKFLSFLK